MTVRQVKRVGPTVRDAVRSVSLPAGSTVKGPAGDPGPAGPVGPQGVPGPQGPAGADGAQGPQGTAGAQGAQGPAGADGASAYALAVAQGYAGTLPQWLASLVGAQGPQGPAGNDGAAGPQGAQGPAGADGADGDQGPQGIQGVQGPAGADGAQGPQGNPGPQGIQGPSGSGAPTIATITSDQAFTSTTPANVTGLSVSLAANTNYRVEALILFTSAATTTGIKPTLTYPAVTVASFNVDAPAAADGTAGMFQGWITASGDAVTATGVQATATTYLARIVGVIRPSAAGTLQVQVGTEVASSAITVKAHSQLIVSVL